MKHTPLNTEHAQAAERRVLAHKEALFGSLSPQIHIQAERWDAASAEAAEGLRLMLDWGTPWDKRMSFHAWAAWARVLLASAKGRSWPAEGNPLGMINLGLVA